jgi:hypothetical protein
MSYSLSDEPIEFECPSCHATVKTTTGAARRSATVRCPNGHEIKTEGSQLDRETRKVERAVDDLLRRFR